MLLDACVLMDLHVSKHMHSRLFSIADKEGPVVCTAASTLAHLWPRRRIWCINRVVCVLQRFLYALMMLADLVRCIVVVVR